MALLGSNHARNRAVAQDAKCWADPLRPFLLRIVAQCQEKPVDEAFPILAAHAAVIVDVALQVGKDTLQLVVGVGHALDLLPCEQIWQVKADAGHGRAQPAVGVECLARLGADGAFFQERIPLDHPRLARNAHGSDREYVEWFKPALDECRQGHYFYGLDEYFNPLREGYIALTGVEGRGLPLPPPGDSDTQSVY